jgi:hypothetical protein
MPSKSLQFDREGALHRRLVSRLSTRVRMAEKGQSEQHDKWRRAEEITLAYMPETEVDARRRANREAGKPTYTTIAIPYSYAMLMSAHTYWTSVFFSRTPIHQYSGRHGEGEMQVQAMEALISYQVEIGQMTGPYYVWLYDAGKYGCGILGHYWEKQILHYGQIVEMPNPLTGVPELFQTTQVVEGYQGNRVYNLSPWDFMHDPRVSLKNFQRGEFCIARCRIGWSKILERYQQGYYNSNIDHLKGHLTDKARTEGSDQLRRPQFDMTLQDDVEEESKHPSGATFYEVFIELVPDEWGLGKGLMYPQKWVFTITEDLELVVGATPLGLVHCQFPFDVLECEIEGYGEYARGMPEIMTGIQETIDWLINSHFFNVRAALNNQFIVDPSKLVIKDVQNSGPGFIWRLRPEAYGTDITKMFAQVQVSDVTRTHLADFQTMLGIGERTLGVNDQIMGTLHTGGRKTATEVRTTTGFGVNRLKTTSEYMSATGFAPHSQKLVQTSQQYYDMQAKLKRVGSYVVEAGEKFINVSPADIAGFYDFVPVDGTLPVDRMAQANLWKELMGNIRMMPPEIAMGYDWSRIFAWVAQLGGLKNITQFKIQLTPQEQLLRMAQQGNVVPMKPPPGRGSPVEPGNAASTQTGNNALQGGSSIDGTQY